MSSLDDFVKFPLDYRLQFSRLVMFQYFTRLVTGALDKRWRALCCPFFPGFRFQQGCVQAVVSERVTALLEARLRSRDSLQTERMSRFLPLAKSLGQQDDEAKVVAMLLDDYYQEVLHSLYFSKGALAIDALRNKLGDELFFKGFKDLFSGQSGRVASLDDYKKTFEKASGVDLGNFIKLWYFGTGLPDY